MHDVAVVGAGPVGLLLSGLLQRAGVSTVVLERRSGASRGSRAIGVHAPVLAALEDSGLTEALLAGAVRVKEGEARCEGRPLGRVRFADTSARFPFVATRPQHETNEILLSISAQPEYDHHVLSINHRPGHVVLRVTHGGIERSVPARVAVVASGAAGRGLVFRGRHAVARAYPDRYVMADVEAEGGPVAVVDMAHHGVLESFPLPGGRRRFVAWDAAQTETGAESAGSRLADALAAHGLRTAAARVTHASGFGVRRFVAPRLRNDRVFVIGDAAHEVSPIGGQGMNLGLLDAAHLAPLLAAWVAHDRPPDDDLRRWERRRVASARIAAAIAAANTRLGRPGSPAGMRAREAGLRTALAPGMRRALAAAYSMGLDRDAL